MYQAMMPPRIEIRPGGFRKKLSLFLHRGSRFECPFCGYRSKELAPIGLDLPVWREKNMVGGGRRNGGCYGCGSSDRERLVFAYLHHHLNLFGAPGLYSLLHIAPDKRLSKMLLAAGFGEYVCGDLFLHDHNYPAHVINLDVTNIPFEADRFDLVICNHVLEHVPDDGKAMSEICRVLKPGGRAILQVPLSQSLALTYEDFSITDPKAREAAFGQYDHVRIYGLDYEERLEASGLVVQKLNLFREFERYGLNPEELLFVATKP
jgi:SAM-dependent methyltransferase